MNKISVVRFLFLSDFDKVKMGLSQYDIKEETMTSKKVCLNVWRNAHAIVTAVQGEIAARWIEVSFMTMTNGWIFQKKQRRFI